MKTSRKTTYSRQQAPLLVVTHQSQLVARKWGQGSEVSRESNDSRDNHFANRCITAGPDAGQLHQKCERYAPDPAEDDVSLQNGG